MLRSKCHVRLCGLVLVQGRAYVTGDALAVGSLGLHSDVVVVADSHIFVVGGSSVASFGRRPCTKAAAASGSGFPDVGAAAVRAAEEVFDRTDRPSDAANNACNA